MRYRTLICLAAGLCLLAPGAALAQRPRVKIDQVKVGFLKNPQEGVFKAGTWAPVYVDVVAPPEGLAKAELAVESTDSDDVRNSYSVPIRSLEPNERVTILTYCRPGSYSNKITAKVKVGNYEYTHDETYMSMQLAHSLYVVAGSKAPGFRRALVAANRKSDPVAGQEEDESQLNDDAGPRRSAFVDDVQLLPTRWFGYEGVDVLYLTTGSREFVEALLNEQEGRKEAIAEWVRRGGRLVMSTGRNQDLASKLGSALQVALPAEITGQKQVASLNLSGYLAGAKPLQSPPSKNNPKAGAVPVEVAQLVPKPNRPTEVPTGLDESKDLPLAVRGPFGLGRVTVVAFDLDVPPFTAWAAQREFWNKFRQQEGREPKVDPNQQRQFGANFYGVDNNEIGTQFLTTLDQFEDVPVISFGWVALFILVYILVVGPLDYFFLKKVVKRLELTWVTFPTVVILISVAAYFTAYYLKGNEQKINKVDVVDVDLLTQRAYGTSWFTIFSPRIQHYTLGAEPAQPSWAPAAKDPNRDFSTVMTWVGRPDTGYGGTGRSGSQSLFRRTYEYEPDAVAIRGVPIQVWTTKSFTTSWDAPLDPQSPLLKADLRFPPKQPELISGTITSNLPVELEDVYLYHYRNGSGQWYFLDRLLPGEPRRVDGILGKGSGMPTNTWLSAVPSEDGKAVQNSPNRRPTNRSPSGAYPTIKQMMFAESDASSGRRNTAFRSLDQSFRLRDSEEVILVGRVARKEGPAEQVAQDPASPTRLWLKGFPGQGKPREPLPGTVLQETYVRALLPVRTVQGE
jgi:hypothetical protein